MLIFFAIVAVFVLYAFVFPRWRNEKLDEILDFLGIGIILFGFLLRISARGYKEDNSLSSNKLVTGGPYALMRNPMYFGTLLIGTGFVITLVEWWALLLFLFIFFWIYIPEVNKEEAVLEHNFGQEYIDYCKITPRYLPRLDYLLSIRKYLPLKLTWIKKELFSLIGTLVCVVIIEVWQDVILFGGDELVKETQELILTIILFIFIILLCFKKKSLLSSKPKL